ncbi:EF-hand [Mycena kentingensis (nom. inval.)]|nr:EF-hand [Mycena kentingensis (nom. inval.)]
MAYNNQYSHGGAYSVPPPVPPMPAPGFVHGGHPPPPPGADIQLWGWFCDVDSDKSGHISAQELDRALVNGDWTRFDLDTVKLLMSIFDTDRSGTIGFNEFAGLWKYIKDWQNVFRHFDRDRSGSIDGNELRDALSQFGFNLSPHLPQPRPAQIRVQRPSGPAAPRNHL